MAIIKQDSFEFEDEGRTYRVQYTVERMGAPPPGPPPPSVTLTANGSAVASQIDKGAVVTIAWQALDAEAVYLEWWATDDGVVVDDQVPASGSRQFAPESTTVFGIRAVGANGQETESHITVNVVPPPPPPGDFDGLVIDGPLECDTLQSSDSLADLDEHGAHVDEGHGGRHFGPTTMKQVRPGRASDPATWDAGRAPGPNDVLLARRVRVAPGCRLKYRNIFIAPDGSLATAPELIDGANSARLTCVGGDFHPGDAQQVGLGVVCLGEWAMAGAPSATVLRLAREARRGDTAVHFGSPAEGWRAGDLFVLPDTRRLGWAENPNNEHGDRNYRWEVAEVASVAPDRLSVSLASPLLHDHLPPRWPSDGSVAAWPAVMMLTSNVTFDCADRHGTHPHFMAHGRADVRLFNVAFRNTGRTNNTPLGPDNVKGRYAFVHLHRVTGPERTQSERDDPTVRQWRVIHCRSYNEPLDDIMLNGRPTHPWWLEPKWHGAIHDSSDGDWIGNVGYNSSGAGFAVETPCVRNNISGNYAMRFGWSFTSEMTRGEEDVGHTSAGFWLAVASHSAFEGNIASGGQMGFDIAPRVWGNSYRVPAWKGADVAAGEYVEINPRLDPITHFKDNEVLGCVADGLQPWWQGIEGPPGPVASEYSVIEGLGVYNCWNFAVYNYMSEKLRFVGSRLCSPGGAEGFHFSDYVADAFEVAGARVEGFAVGYLVGPLGDQTVTGGRWHNAVDFSAGVIWVAGTPPQWLPPRTLTLDGVASTGGIFLSLDGTPHQADRIASGQVSDSTNLRAANVVVVKGLRGVPGDDWRAYYDEQAPDAPFQPDVMRGSGEYVAILGCPEPGLTNAESLERHGVCWGGELMPGGAAAAGWLRGGKAAPLGRDD